MPRTIHVSPIGSLSGALVLSSIAISTLLLGCGFHPQPQSGTVICHPQGAACCPEGYLCVGRGLNTAGGPSAGICWSRRELPPEAVAGTHDYTPAVPNDPACLVTDWLPPELVGIGPTPDAGTSNPDGPVAVGEDDAGPDTGGTTAVTPVVPAAVGTLSAGNATTYQDVVVITHYLLLARSAFSFYVN